MGIAVFDDVIAGDDGWLFLAGGSNEVMRFYSERDFMSGGMKSAWANALDERSERCRNRGITYLHLSVPDKLTVYRDKINGSGLLKELAPTEAMPSFLKQSGTTAANEAWLDLCGPLAEARRVEDVYWKTDTHWTFSGAYAAYLAVCERLRATANHGIKARGSIFFDIYLDLGGKLIPPRSERFVMKQFLRDAHRYWCNDFVAAKEKHDLQGDAGLHAGSEVAFRNSWEGRDPRRVLIFGDSYCEYRPHLLTGMLAETFTETRFIWSSQVDWAIVDEFKPDILITEIAERFMRVIPTTDGFSLSWLLNEKMNRVDELLRLQA